MAFIVLVRKTCSNGADGIKLRKVFLFIFLFYFEVRRGTRSRTTGRVRRRFRNVVPIIVVALRRVTRRHLRIIAVGGCVNTMYHKRAHPCTRAV